MNDITVSAGGIIVVESRVDTSPEPSPARTPTGKCVSCGKECYEPFGLLSSFTKDGFIRESPTCKHADILICPDCRGKGVACPECGCRCFYT